MKKIVLDNELFMTEVNSYLNSGQTVEIKVRGHSMLPFYRHEKTVVSLKKKDDYVVNDVVLFKYQNQYILHRIIKIKNDFYHILGDGSFTVHVLGKEDILGYVLDFKTNGKQIKNYMFKVKLWRLFSPFKRILLKFVRK